MIDHHPMKRSPGSRRDPERLVRTICQECSVACGLVAGVAQGRVVDVQGDEDHPVSRGRLCARGTAFVQGLTLPERLVAPAVRRKRGGALEPEADWKAAVDLLAEQLRAVRERHGPDALVIGCDREGGLDFHLGALRFAKLWGTAQVFHADGDPGAGGLRAPAAPTADWLNARRLLLVEADLAASHPVAFGWIQEAQRRGAEVIAVDARFTPTLAHADVGMRLRPGQGNLLGLALAKLLLAQRPPEDPAVAGAFPDAVAWRAALEQMSLDGADVALGASPEHLARLAGHLASGPVTVITGRALAGEAHHGVWRCLARAMGWTGRPGGGWYPLDAGAPAPCAEADLPGDAAPDRGGRERARPSLAEVTARGDVRAVICSGDALAAHLAPFGGLAAQAEVVAHFGSFANATREAATASFPAALWAEREGLFFGGDRTVEWGRAIAEPPAGCRSGLEFWTELARRFGWEKHFPWTTEDGRADPVAFSRWVLERTPELAGLELDAIREAGPGLRCTWPVAADDAAAPPPPPSLAGASADPAFPLALVAAASGSRSGDASRFWPWTRALVSEDAVEIHPETARRLGIENGAEVAVDAAGGTRPARAVVSRAVSRWAVASLRGPGGLPVLVRRAEQSPDAARALLHEARP